jgi:ATP-dependent helicase HrpB
MRQQFPLRQALPVDQEVPRILDELHRSRALVVVAPPGSGKTTRIAPAVAAVGKTILLQPRRVAARCIARRIAFEQDWILGQTVGWQVRFERHYNPQTRLLIATEGILTSRLQTDPLLTDFKSIILDEFHERSLHADVSLALARQAWLARDDLWLVVMSATLNAGPIAQFLGNCPIIEIKGQAYPVETNYWPHLTPAAAVRRVLETSQGHVLCFLPGTGDIQQVQNQLLAGGLISGTQVLPLHGALSSSAQDAALAEITGRKVILATNIAETSLTIEGVRVVVDSGYHKVLKYDITRGIDLLELERIPWDSAEQRAGRAGRTAPGLVVRLWDQGNLLAPRRVPEIQRVDLAAPALDILAWGEDPCRFDWFEPPLPERLEAAMSLLRALGAVENDRLTQLGELLRRFPLHPRLAKVLVEAGGTQHAADCCALLSEKPLSLPPDRSTHSDILSQVDEIISAPTHIRQVAQEITSLSRHLLGRRQTTEDNEEVLLRALWAGFPDRVAQRRAPGSDRFLLASGGGARLARESGVREGEFIVALDVAAGTGQATSEALIRQASLVRKKWLRPNRIERTHIYDAAEECVKAYECEMYFALMLIRRPVSPDPEAAFPLLVEALQRRELDKPSRLLVRRVEKAGFKIDRENILQKAALGQVCLPQVRLRDYMDASVLETTRHLCPETLLAPSGRRLRLDYCDDGTVRMTVKLQELFGLEEVPRVGKDRELVIVELLAPNGLPVQTTTDLRSFWKNTYPLVRKELRGRYPKHSWPENPRTAIVKHQSKRA